MRSILEERGTPEGYYAALVDKRQAHAVMNMGVSGFEDGVFCTYTLLSAVQGMEDKVYLWALCQDYYLD
jgi:hypothetical protein